MQRLRSFVDVATEGPISTADRSEAAAQDLEAELLQDLNRYPLRKFRTLFGLWLFTGLVGGHRYYLGQTVKGALMTLTYGGVGLWWLRDLFRLRKLLNEYNSQQMARRTRQEPPLELAYLPLSGPEVWDRPYAFATGIMGRLDLAERNPPTLRGDLILVACISLLMSYVCSASGQYEPLASVVLLTALLNLRAFRGSEWLQRLGRRSRLVREVLQWELKLRLYYHSFGVPKPSRLLFRPLTSIQRLFSRRHTGEAQMYLDASYILAAAFTLFDILSGTYNEAIASGEVTEIAAIWFKQNIIVLLLVYSFVTPLGATLMKFDLNHPQSARDRFVLSAVAFIAAISALL